MDVLSIRQINLELSDLFNRRPLFGERHERYAGLHQSDVLKYIAVKTGKMKKGERLEEDLPWACAMGFMWEEFYFSLHPEYYWAGEKRNDHLHEKVINEVAVNCDGHYPSPQMMIETKCTKCKVLNTADDLLDKFSKGWWVYHHQGRAECHAFGPNTVMWPILHYDGDWKGSGPVVMEYTVEFTNREIADTWRMIQVNKAEMEEKGLTA